MGRCFLPLPILFVLLDLPNVFAYFHLSAILEEVETNVCGQPVFFFFLMQSLNPSLTINRINILMFICQIDFVI